MKIGVDLGTTNSAVADIDEREAEDRDFPPILFETPQLFAPGRSRSARCLCSCFSNTAGRRGLTRRPADQSPESPTAWGPGSVLANCRDRRFFRSGRGFTAFSDSTSNWDVDLAERAATQPRPEPVRYYHLVRSMV